MMTCAAFEKKQVIFLFPNEGEKISFSNDNVVVKDSCGQIKHQSTCYRIFALFIAGDMTMTTVIVRQSHKFGFPIYLMTPSLRPYDVIGHKTEGNSILRRIQYDDKGLDIAKHIVENKITNQMDTLNLQRGKSNSLREDVLNLKRYAESARTYNGDLQGLMGIEGSASRVYFRNNFDMPGWTGRKPRIKSDYINSTLDIGYTMLFNFVDSMLGLYGFDTYVGVYHREFYLRKSLACDLMEPFRPLIDWNVRKAIHLGQFKADDFNISNGRYLLDIRKNKEYVEVLMKPLMRNKNEIFTYFQSYYRAVMKHKDVSNFPVFRIGDE
jgi:CRISPR-associated protein Cas1